MSAITEVNLIKIIWVTLEIKTWLDWIDKKNFKSIKYFPISYCHPGLNLKKFTKEKNIIKYPEFIKFNCDRKQWNDTTTKLRWNSNWCFSCDNQQ